MKVSSLRKKHLKGGHCVFMCKKCFDVATKNRGLFLQVSTGPCEECGKVNICADVPSDIQERYATQNNAQQLTNIYGVTIEKPVIPF